jgi:hypothetical protein
MDVYKDNAFRMTVSDGNLASGAVALYGEFGTTARFDNVFVRQYAAVEPVVTLGAPSTGP